jgi:cold shock CspA family protein
MRIERWIPERGFGFVRLQDGRHVFVHASKVLPVPPRGVNLTGLEVDEQSLQVVKAEKGWQAEKLVVLVKTKWTAWSQSLDYDVLWPGGCSYEVREYSEYFFNVDSLRSPAWNEEGERVAIEKGCPPELIDGLRKRYSVYKAEYEEKQAKERDRIEALMEAKSLPGKHQSAVIFSPAEKIWITEGGATEEFSKKISDFFGSIVIMGSNSHYQWGIIPYLPDGIFWENGGWEFYLKEDLIYTKRNVYYVLWRKIEKKVECSSSQNDSSLPWKYQEGSVLF